MLMAVPTMYSYLLTYFHNKLGDFEKHAAQKAAAALRLTVSGSAACPAAIMQQWEELSGQVGGWQGACASLPACLPAG